MPGCVLRVTGQTFDVDAFLTSTELRPCHVHRRGDVRRRSEIFPHSGLSLDISNANGDLAREVTDAIHFLNTHHTELQKLKDFPGVTDLRLDFGYYRRDVVAQFDYLPPELLRLAGSFGIGIELSLYPRPESEDHAVVDAV